MISRFGNASVPIKEGLTLLEVLIGVSLASILLALLSPAIVASREASRRITCQSKLRQIGFAIASHEVSHHHLPTNGWGAGWVGDPDKSFGRDQPGGWIFNTLPFLELSSIRDFTIGKAGQEKLDAGATMQTLPLLVFQCPSRGRDLLEPYRARFPLANSLYPNDSFRSDYAGNGGSVFMKTRYGPMGTSEAAIYSWLSPHDQTGIFFPRSTVRLSEITDGLSCTYLIGEKYHRPTNNFYLDPGYDDQSALIGDSWDVRRVTDVQPQKDGAIRSLQGFGSSHPGACNMAFADGSVRPIEFNIDATLHRHLGNKKDGQALPAYW